MLSLKYPTTTKTTRMEKGETVKGAKGNNMESGIQNLLQRIEREKQIPEEEQKET